MEILNYLYDNYGINPITVLSTITALFFILLFRKQMAYLIKQLFGLIIVYEKEEVKELQEWEKTIEKKFEGRSNNIDELCEQHNGK